MDKFPLPQDVDWPSHWPPTNDHYYDSGDLPMNFDATEAALREKWGYTPAGNRATYGEGLFAAYSEANLYASGASKTLNSRYKGKDSSGPVPADFAFRGLVLGLWPTARFNWFGVVDPSSVWANWKANSGEFTADAAGWRLANLAAMAGSGHPSGQGTGTLPKGPGLVK